MRRLLTFILLVLVFITGCNSKEENITSDITDWDSTSSISNESPDLISQLEITNVNTRRVGELNYIVGEIKNNSYESIDEIGDLAIYDEQGNLINVNKILIKISAGGVMAFDELAGRNVNPYSVRITDL